MSLGLEDVYYQASNSYYAVNVSNAQYDAYVLKGILIKKYKDTGSIEICNTKKGGYKYPEIPDDDYNIFLEHGFEMGCIELSLKNITESLGIVKEVIQLEITKRRNTKALASAKGRREMLLNKYNKTLKLKSKLNHE